MHDFYFDTKSSNLQYDFPRYTACLNQAMRICDLLKWQLV